MLPAPRRPLALALAAAALAALVPAARAQCLSWTPSPSGPDGFQGTCSSLLATSIDGHAELLYGGGLASAGGLPAGGVARWDGARWDVLTASPPGLLRALAALDVAGSTVVYAGGAFDDGSTVLAWDGDGWTALPPNRSETVAALAVFDDGSGPALLAAGTRTVWVGPFPTTAGELERWDGAAWSPVAAFDSLIDALLVREEPGGSALYAAGAFWNVGSVPARGVARWDGAAWTALGAGLPGRVRALCDHDFGSGARLCAGGEFLQPARVASWDGAAWSQVGDGLGGGGVDALASYGARLHAAGTFTSSGAANVRRLARYDGAAWSEFGGGTPAGSRVDRLAVFGAGTAARLYVAGDFDALGGSPARNTASWDGFAWHEVGRGALDGSVRDLETFDGALHVAGMFDHAGALEVGGVARWDGAAWRALGTGTDGSVDALAVADLGAGPALFLGGSFQSADFAPARSIARWDGFSYFPLSWGTNGPVHALAGFDEGAGTRLFAAGSFTEAGGLLTWHVARWDGAAWSQLGSGVDAPARALRVHDDGSGPALYVAGDFSWASGVHSPGVVRWDGAAWSAVGPGIDGEVHALAVHDDGGGPRLYAGGAFAQAGGQLASNVARWDGAAWTPVGAGLPARVLALEVFDGGNGPELHAGGKFAGSAHVARWDGAAWTTVGGGTDGDVRALHAALAPPGAPARLWIGGDFASAGGQAALRLAAFGACAGPVDAFCAGDAASCPCANPGAPGHGCASSASPSGALLDASGTTGPDALVLTASALVPGATCVVLQGGAGVAAVPFGSGLRCVGGTLVRLYVRVASPDGAAVAPLAGEPSITQRSAELGDPIAPGSSRAYQVVHRDPAGPCPPPAAALNATNALHVVW